MRAGRSAASNSSGGTQVAGETFVAPEEQKAPSHNPVRVGEESTLDRLRKQ